MGIVLRNVRLDDGTNLASLRFSGDRIGQVVEGDLSLQPNDDVIDAEGKLAIPGFVNAHCHLPMVILRGWADDVPLSVWLKDYVWPVEKTLTPEDVHSCALLALAESIRCGTVAVADMYFHTEAVARAVQESGLRGLLSYGMVAESMDARGRGELRTAGALAEAWHGQANGLIQVAVSPHTVYTCGEDVLRAAADLARDLHLLIHTHVSESREEVSTCIARTGMTPPAYLNRLGIFDVPTLAAHCVHVTDEDIAILADRGVAVAHCPKSNAKLGNGVAPITRMRDHGITVALGTDGAASNNRLDMIEELRAAWIVERAGSEDAAKPSAHDVLTMAIREGRAALRLPPANLRPGDAADVVLLDTEGSHVLPSHPAEAMIAFSSQASDVTDVFVAGRALLRNRQLLTIDEERVQSEVIRLRSGRKP